MPALSGSGYSWDDQVVFFSYALTVMIAIATEFTLKNGSALDEYTLTAHQIKEYMIWTYVSEVLYNTVIITTKIAVSKTSSRTTSITDFETGSSSLPPHLVRRQDHEGVQNRKLGDHWSTHRYVHCLRLCIDLPMRTRLVHVELHHGRDG